MLDESLKVALRNYLGGDHDGVGGTIPISIEETQARVAAVRALVQEYATGRYIRPTPDMHESTGQWVVVIPQQSWTSCYGPFADHDECCAWLRANGWHPSEANIHPILTPTSLRA